MFVCAMMVDRDRIFNSIRLTEALKSNLKCLCDKADNKRPAASAAAEKSIEAVAVVDSTNRH